MNEIGIISISLLIVVYLCVGHLSCLVLEVERREEKHAFHQQEGNTRT